MSGVLRLGLGLLLVFAASPGGGAIELEPIPSVRLEVLPEEARDELAAQIERVEALLAAPERDSREVAEAFGDLARICNQLDLTALARTAWSNAAALAPGDPRWHYFLGVLDRLEGDLPAAIGRFERVLELRPEDLATRIRLGRTLLVTGDAAAAEASFRAALDRAPASAAALHGLGRSLAAQGRADEAIEAFQAALVDQPAGSIIHHELGMVLRERGDLDAAREHLAKNEGAAVTFPDPWMTQLLPGAPGAFEHLRLGLEALAAGETATAVAQLQRAAQLEPDSAWIRYNLGIAHWRAGSSEAAVEQLRAVLALDESYRDAHAALGEILSESGDDAAAVRHFERAREIDPLDRDAHLGLAVALGRMGATDRSLAEIETLLAEEPSYAPAHLAKATLLAGAGRPAEAREALDRMLAGDATPAELAEAHVLAGRIVESSDAAAAEAEYRAALRLDPESEAGRRGLAMLLGRQGRYAAAAEEFARLVAARPEEVSHRVGEAMSLLLGERYPAAVASLEAAVERFPDAASVSLLLARVLAACPEASVRDGERALGLAIGPPGAERTLERAETVAMALAELGRYEEAAELQRQVVEQLEASGAGGGPSLGYLRNYEAGRPVRAPWAAGGA